MLEAYNSSEEAKQLFAKLGVDFPGSDAEVPAFVDDLSDSQAEALAKFFAAE